MSFIYLAHTSDFRKLQTDFEGRGRGSSPAAAAASTWTCLQARDYSPLSVFCSRVRLALSPFMVSENMLLASNGML